MDTDLKINFNCTRQELKGFQDYFEQKMYPTLVEMEESRAKATNKVIRNGILALIPLGLAVISYFVMAPLVGNTAHSMII